MCFIKLSNTGVNSFKADGSISDAFTHTSSRPVQQVRQPNIGPSTFFFNHQECMCFPFEKASWLLHSCVHSTI